MNEDLIMRLRLTNQFYPNADVSTEEVVAALEAAQPAPQCCFCPACFVEVALDNCDAVTRDAKLWREQAAQPVGKPVAWLVKSKTGMTRTRWTTAPSETQLAVANVDGDNVIPLYTRPASQVPMTEAEIVKAALESPLRNTYWLSPEIVGYEDEVQEITAFVRIVEAHHKIGVKV